MSGGLALIFDLDGVIVNSNPVHSVCWRRYLAGFAVEVPEDFDVKMFGKRNDDILREVFGRDTGPEVLFRHGAAKEELYRKMMGPVLKEHLVPGLVEFLERHKDLPMAVASNAEPANVEFVLETGGLRSYFRAAVNGQQVERPKPDPEIYLRAAQELGTEPPNCVVFEDSVAGLEAARAARTRVVGLRTTHAMENVDLSIRDFSDAELEPWLAAQRAL